MTNSPFVWMALGIMALLIELSMPGLFFFLSLAIGSLAAACLWYFEYSIIMQLIFCFFISLCSLFFLRRYVKKTMQQAGIKTNTHALIGKELYLLEPATKATAGTAKVYGDTWLVREKQGNSIDTHTKVRVIDVQGCHLIVQEL
jgi:membrane protein implicated in regulation of membrane protease activity